LGTIQGLCLYANGAKEMIYEVQTYDTSDKTVYYEVVEDAIDYEDARDVIVEKYPNRKVIAVIGRNK
jgi:hypothetical protein